MMDSNEIRESNSDSEICKFYENKSIFVTGATGFLGKALIEKLLRSCFSLKKIYVLVRNKKGKDSSQRLDEITDFKLFDTVKNEHPEFKEKLVAINGDLTLPNLGISDENEQILIDNVNIVFHSAATVRFDEPLRIAVEMNIIGVKRVIDLAKKLKHLESFVHVSTAYANCDRIEINETVYPAQVNADQLIDATEWIEAEILDSITPKLIQNKPNTYTYTKAIAESLVAEECRQIPCTIVRPSIIGASWKEPFPGWIDNFNGPTALFPATGTGILQSMLGNKQCIADIVPVDIPVNLMIASAWHTTLSNKKSDNLIVYNCTSGQINKFTWGMFEDFGRDFFFQNPFENIILIPNPHFTTNKFVRLQGKVKKAVEILEFFTLKEWKFSNENLYKLMSEMNKTDNQIFNFDIRELDWKSYVEEYCLGTKVHLLKEDPSERKKNRRKITRLRVLRGVILSAIFFIFMAVFLI